MPFPLTQEQRRAVEDRGGCALVSAAAGSGKTRVLVERLLDRVVREGLDIDRFLVITYTRAAAAELRGRIAQELSARLAQTPGDRHLRRQAALVYQAQISTVHAFCAALLRESGAALELDPDFRLCDEGEAAVLMAQALGRVMDRQYEELEPESDFAQLVDTMSAGRDDSRLMQIVLDVSGRIQSHPDPEGWLREQDRLWELKGVSDAGETPWGALLLEDARRQLRHCRARLEQALALCGRDEVLRANYAPSLSESLAGVERALLAAGWDDARRALLAVDFPAAGRKRGGRDEQAARRVKELRGRAKKQLDKLSARFEDSSAQLLEDMALARPAVRGLTELVRQFQREYGQEKRRRGVLDFSDLEHLALGLLTGADGQPTPLARQWGDRFEEIMVDEYQDTNQVQNAIFTALSGGGRRLFLVGDVKQSIYRFRLADPTIFLEKYRSFRPWDQAAEGEPRRLLLKRNFRSRPQVLEGVNDLFRDIMSVEFGEMDYTDEQALVPGASFPEGGDCRLELAVLDLEGEEDEEEQEREDKNLQEARYAARRIRQMLDGGFPVSQGEGTRPVRPEDVMILLRSPGAVLHHYIRALSEEGIPWSADTGEDFFAATEVNVALSLLQVVDNPRQDVALIAALRSPVYGFTGDRLSQLRAEAQGDFYSAVVRAAGAGEEDCRAFLEELSQLRLGAGERTCRQLIWHIYQRTGMLALFGAMPGGEERRGRLLALYELAGRLEEAGCRTLFDFLLRLDRLRAGGERLSAPARELGGVSVMSIHRSKGLERPVVLVCGLARRLNREDMQRPVLFHPRLGVGPRRLDRERGIESTTLARQAVSVQLEREMMAEEMRLLYVAMTRAREKLILTVALPRAGRELERLGEAASRPVPPQALAECAGVGQWVLLSALCRPEAGVLRAAAGMEEPEERGGFGPAWDIRLVDPRELPAPGAGEREEEAPEGADLNEEALRARFAWQYGHEAACGTPSKLTATQLKGRALDQEAAQEAPPPRSVQAPLYRPDFAARRMGLTPAQRGTALHLAMQYLDFARTGSAQEIAGEVERLVREEYLTPLQGQAADPERLAAFFRSPLGREMAAAESLHREFKFSMLVPAGEYFPGVEGEQVLLQGVVDGWYETPEGIVVVDFKSDQVREETVRSRAEEYRPQLAAYSRALGELTGRPIARRVLWFFALDRAVEV